MGFGGVVVSKVATILCISNSIEKYYSSSVTFNFKIFNVQIYTWNALRTRDTNRYGVERMV